MEHEGSESLSESIQLQANAIVSRMVMKKPNGNITLFAFDEGQSLAEHTSPFDALIYLLEGNLQVTISEKPFQVKHGDYIYLPSGKPHGVIANAPSKFILVMIK